MVNKEKKASRQGRSAGKSGLPRRAATGRAAARASVIIGSPREGTVGRIIDGTIDALCAQGFRGLTTRKIATAAGVQLATLHYHFKNKDELLLSVLDTITARVAAALREDVPPSRDLKESIDNVLDAGWRFVLSSRQLQIVQCELAIYALRTRGVEWLARRQYRDYIKAHELVFSAHAPNTPRARAFIHELARLVMAGIDGIILQELVESDPKRSERSIRLLAESAKALVDARKKDLST